MRPRSTAVRRRRARATDAPRGRRARRGRLRRGVANDGEVVVELPTARQDEPGGVARAEVALGAHGVVVEVDQPGFALGGLKAQGRGGRSPTTGAGTEPPSVRVRSVGPSSSRWSCPGPGFPPRPTPGLRHGGGRSPGHESVRHPARLHVRRSLLVSRGVPEYGVRGTGRLQPCGEIRPRRHSGMHGRAWGCARPASLRAARRRDHEPRAGLPGANPAAA